MYTPTHHNLHFIKLFFALIYFTPSTGNTLTFKEFTGLGFLKNDSIASYALDVSADGKIIVGYNQGATLNSGKTLGFQYTKSKKMRLIGSFPIVHGQDSYKATHISGDGTRIFVSTDKGTNWVYTQNQSYERIRANGVPIQIQGVSYDGQTLTGIYLTNSTLSGTEAFLYDLSKGTEEFNRYVIRRALAENKTFFGNPSNGSSSGTKNTAISSDGKIIIGSFVGEPEGRYSFKYSKSTGIINLGSLKFTKSSFTGELTIPHTEAIAISPDGSTIVGSSSIKRTTPFLDKNGIRHFCKNTAFRYTDKEGMLELDSNYEFDTIAIGASSNGRVIIGKILLGDVAKDHEAFEAFVWTDDTKKIQNLQETLEVGGFDLSDWDKLKVTAISDDGYTIVGSGLHFGKNEAFVARISSIPLPSSAWLFFSSVFFLIRLKKKRTP